MQMLLYVILLDELDLHCTFHLVAICEQALLSDRILRTSKQTGRHEAATMSRSYRRSFVFHVLADAAHRALQSTHSSCGAVSSCGM